MRLAFVAVLGSRKGGSSSCEVPRRNCGIHAAECVTDGKREENNECQLEEDMAMDMDFPSRTRCFTIIDDARTPNRLPRR